MLGQGRILREHSATKQSEVILRTLITYNSFERKGSSHSTERIFNALTSSSRVFLCFAIEFLMARQHLLLHIPLLPFSLIQ